MLSPQISGASSPLAIVVSSVPYACPHEEISTAALLTTRARTGKRQPMPLKPSHLDRKVRQAIKNVQAAHAIPLINLSLSARRATRRIWRVPLSRNH
jgi:hypothetical protein